MSEISEFVNAALKDLPSSEITNQLIKDAVKQLERSERGQMTCKLLRDFLQSHTVRGLDAHNCSAVATLVVVFMAGFGRDCCEVVDSLTGAVDRNQWVNQ
jgi:hypothetical protein